MLLYKFRSIDPLQHVLDIALHERLYCADYAALNDPFEGQFIAMESPWSGVWAPGVWKPNVWGKAVPSDVSRLSGGNCPLKVCSLSATATDVRMWSLYASGHKGVAFELDATHLVPPPFEVDYHDKLRKHEWPSDLRPEDVLTCKTEEWKYETEYRLFSAEPFVSVQGRIRRVVLGVRASADLEVILRRTVAPNVEVVRARLDANGAGVIISPPGPPDAPTMT